MDGAMTSRAYAVDVLRVDGRTSSRRPDFAAVEEPLEIRLQGSPFIVTMRTPGADRELAAGFLLSERIILDADDLGTIRHCTDVDAGAEGNVLDVTLVGPAQERAETALAATRPVTTTSACGVCGRRSIGRSCVQHPQHHRRLVDVRGNGRDVAGVAAWRSVGL